MSPALPLSQRRPRASGTMPYSVSLVRPLRARRTRRNESCPASPAEPTTRTRPPPSVAIHTRPPRVDREGIDRIRWQRRGVVRIVAEYFEHVPSARARLRPPPSVPIQRLPRASSAIAVTIGALTRAGSGRRTAADGSRRSPGSSTLAPPPNVPIQICPLRDSRCVMMPAALVERGSPGSRESTRRARRASASSGRRHRADPQARRRRSCRSDITRASPRRSRWPTTHRAGRDAGLGIEPHEPAVERRDPDASSAHPRTP